MSASSPPLRDSYEDILQRAQMAWVAGNLQETIAHYRRLFERLGRLSERILDRRPELRDMYRDVNIALAFLYRQEGRYAEAIEVKEALLAVDPERAGIWRRDLATLRVAKGEVETGLAELRALTEEHPDDLWNWLALARESRIEGRFADSQAALERGLDVGRQGDAQDLAQVYYQRFHLFKEMGQLDDAATAWEEALALHSDMGDTVREVYTMFTDVGRYSDARRYVARDGNALRAGYQRGLIAQLTASPVEARQEWQAVADLDPRKYKDGHDAWVEAVLRLGDPAPALEQLQVLLKEKPTPRLLILSGIAWAMRGDQELASALFQQAINLTRRQRPPKKKLDSADWRLLNSLVADDELKATLKTYFAVVETLWGS